MFALANPNRPLRHVSADFDTVAELSSTYEDSAARGEDDDIPIPGPPLVHRCARTPPVNVQPPGRHRRGGVGDTT